MSGVNTSRDDQLREGPSGAPPPTRGLGVGQAQVVRDERDSYASCREDRAAERAMGLGCRTADGKCEIGTDRRAGLSQVRQCPYGAKHPIGIRIDDGRWIAFPVEAEAAAGINQSAAAETIADGGSRDTALDVREGLQHGGEVRDPGNTDSDFPQTAKQVRLGVDLFGGQFHESEERGCNVIEFMCDALRQRGSADIRRFAWVRAFHHDAIQRAPGESFEST